MDGNKETRLSNVSFDLFFENYISFLLRMWVCACVKIKEIKEKITQYKTYINCLKFKTIKI